MLIRRHFLAGAVLYAVSASFPALAQTATGAERLTEEQRAELRRRLRAAGTEEERARIRREYLEQLRTGAGGQGGDDVRAPFGDRLTERERDEMRNRLRDAQTEEERERIRQEYRERAHLRGQGAQQSGGQGKGGSGQQGNPGKKPLLLPPGKKRN